MITRNNIKCFDYIYESSFNDNNKLTDLESKFFDNLSKNYIDFVNENRELLENPELLIAQGNAVVVNNFPKLNSTGIKEYYSYKKKEFIKVVESDLNYNFNKITSDVNVFNQLALIKLIDYFIDQDIIECSDEYYTKNIIGRYDFDFSKLKINPKIYYKEISEAKNTSIQYIEQQVNIEGNNNKWKNNEISNKKVEQEKEDLLTKIIKNIKNIKNIFSRRK